MLVECFVYTNGRSTYDYCTRFLKKSIECFRNKDKQLSKEVHVFRNKRMVDAMNRTLDMCKGTHFIQVGDDFILHSYAIQYMLKQVCKSENHNIAMYNWHLWEVWTSKIISGIKIYSVEALKDIGGFIEDKYAKVDKVTHTKLQEEGWEVLKDPSVVGLHACGTWEEQLKYEKLWSDAAGLDYRKSTHGKMRQYQVPISEQVKEIESGFLEKINKRRRTPFNAWLEGRKQITLKPSKSKR